MDWSPFFQGMGAAGVFIFAALLTFRGLFWPKPIVDKFLAIKDEIISEERRRNAALEAKLEVRDQQAALVLELARTSNKALTGLHEAASDRGPS